MKQAAPATFQSPYVRADSDVLRGALLVAPSAPLSAERPLQGEASPILERALEQYGILRKRLAAHGVAGIEIQTAPEHRMSSQIADLAVVFPAGAFLMRPSEERRRHEVGLLEDALRAANVPIAGRIESPGLLDGGDVLLGHDALYLAAPVARASTVGIASGSHGNAFGREQLAAYARSVGLRDVTVPLAADARRLRAVAALIGADTVLFAPQLVDGDAFGGRRKLEAPGGEAYGAGVLVLAERFVLANVRSAGLIPLLHKHKIAVDAIDLWEFGKVGFAPASLIVALKRG